MSINAKNTQDESLHPDPIGNSNMSLTKETISIEEISVEQTDVSNNAQDTDVNLDEEVKTQEDTKSDIELGPLNIELEPSRASQEPEKEDVSNEHERSQEQPVKNENENLQPPLQRKLSEPKLKQETEAQIKLKQETQRRAINLKNTRDMVENIRLGNFDKLTGDVCFDRSARLPRKKLRSIEGDIFFYESPNQVQVQITYRNINEKLKKYKKIVSNFLIQNSNYKISFVIIVVKNNLNRSNVVHLRIFFRKFLRQN